MFVFSVYAYVCVYVRVCVFVVRMSMSVCLLELVLFFFGVRVICLMFYLIEYEIATTLHGNIFQATQAV